MTDQILYIVMINQILNGVIVFGKNIFGVLIFVHIFPEKRWEKKCAGMLGWCILYTYAAISAWASSRQWISLTSMIMDGIVYACLLRIFYRCRFPDAWIWIWLYNIGYSLVKVPFMIIRGFYLDSPILFLNQDGRWGAPENLFCFFQLCAICFFYFKYIKQAEILRKQLIKCRKHWYLFLLAEADILILISMTLDMGLVPYGVTDIMMVMFFIFLVLILFLLYAVYTMYGRSREKEKNLSIQREILSRENEVIIEYCRQDAKRLHDLKHVWVYLLNCLEEKRYENAVECVQRQLEEVKLMQRKTMTGISEIDLILDYKQRQMESCGILLFLDIQVDVLPMSGENFMIVLGNLLDNAIEGAQKCDRADRKIQLGMKNANEMFWMKIRNTCTGEKRKERWETIKADSVYHGWGMKNVEEIVRSVGGEVDYTCEENWFEVNILI